MITLFFPWRTSLTSSSTPPKLGRLYLALGKGLASLCVQPGLAFPSPVCGLHISSLCVCVVCVRMVCVRMRGVCVRCVCMCRVEMDRFEHVVSMKVLALRSQETMAGRKEYIVVGTTTVCGEDVQCKGKVKLLLLFDLVPLL